MADENVRGESEWTPRLDMPAARHQAAVAELANRGCDQPGDALRDILAAAGYRLRVTADARTVASVEGPWAVDLGRDDDDAPVYINLDDFTGPDICLFTGDGGRGKRTKVLKLLSSWHAKGAKIVAPAEQERPSQLVVSGSQYFSVSRSYGDLIEQVEPQSLAQVLAELQPHSQTPVVLVLDDSLLSWDTKKEHGLYGPAVDLRHFAHMDGLHVLAVYDSRSFHRQNERRRYAAWARATAGWGMSVALNIHCIWGIWNEKPYWEAYAEVPGVTITPRWFTPDITPPTESQG
ncbi:Uncharacterised protein [Mycobacteroides abscessus subsp. abscessus]|uniref:hypothetical protein n=1 Tax=Mycobacteroides abscessus TaxID=36809 RepID=UPI000927BE98|nr:hypothetical protein [Mycobacteroides abscessus]SHU66562.1 Uncharacterised protein [Mycobacteroides abscessus subsp. abscessus]